MRRIVLSAWGCLSAAEPEYQGRNSVGRFFNAGKKPTPLSRGLLLLVVVAVAPWALFGWTWNAPLPFMLTSRAGGDDALIRTAVLVGLAWALAVAGTGRWWEPTGHLEMKEPVKSNLVSADSPVEDVDREPRDSARGATRLRGVRDESGLWNGVGPRDDVRPGLLPGESGASSMRLDARTLRGAMARS